MTHSHLDDLDQRQLRCEIADSKTALEQVTGLPVEHFSCPGGRWNRKVVEVARAAGYLSMATSRASANSPNTDLFALGRVVVMRGTKEAKFHRLCKGQDLWSMRLQDSSRALAKRFLGNTIYDRLRSGLLLRRIR